MTPDRWIELSYETFVLGRILAIIPGTLPSMREARIQNHKLSRMVDKHMARYRGIQAGLRALAGASEKKWKKAEGKEAQLVGAQARKVRAQCDKAFKEFLRTDKPKLTNAEYRHWRTKFDKGMEESIRKFIEDVMKRGPLFGDGPSRHKPLTT